jgi:hypothetical protein
VSGTVTVAAAEEAAESPLGAEDMGEDSGAAAFV